MVAPRVNRLSRNIRLTRLTVHLAVGLLKSTVYPHLSPVRQQRMARKWARQFLRILNIRLDVNGILPDRQHTGVLFSANHTSWLDILVILAVYPTRFVAKSEIRAWPLIGKLCSNTGTLFIAREKRSDAYRINQMISQVLQAGDSVVIFPEGRIGDGETLQHFHAALLQPAVNTQTQLCPLAIRYENCDGSRNTSVVYDNVSIFQSLIQIMNESDIRAAVTFNDPISGANKNRRELARLAEQAVASALALKVRHKEPEIRVDLPDEPQ